MIGTGPLTPPLAAGAIFRVGFFLLRLSAAAAAARSGPRLFPMICFALSGRLRRSWSAPRARARERNAQHKSRSLSHLTSLPNWAFSVFSAHSACRVHGQEQSPCLVLQGRKVLATYTQPTRTVRQLTVTSPGYMHLSTCSGAVGCTLHVYAWGKEVKCVLPMPGACAAMIWPAASSEFQSRIIFARQFPAASRFAAPGDAVAALWRAERSVCDKVASQSEAHYQHRGRCSDAAPKLRDRAHVACVEAHHASGNKRQRCSSRYRERARARLRVTQCGPLERLRFPRLNMPFMEPF